MDFELVILLINVDLPAFGKPNNPTSAINLSSRSISLLSESSPLVIFLGDWLVEDLKRALPSPPFPPFAIIISTDSGLISPISSPVSRACITVPFGTGMERFSPDLPGIIEGASQGLGLGTKFLKHAYRTKFLLHLVDGTQTIEDALKSFEIIEKELADFHLDFSNQKRWICITKIDLIDKTNLSKLIREFQAKYSSTAIYPISSISGDGIDILREELFKQI